MRGDIQVSTVESELTVRRNENPTLIIELAIPLSAVTMVTLEETPSEKILVEQA